MASLNGAKVISMEHKRGILAAGKIADIVVLDNLYNVEMTIKHGKIVYQRVEETI